MTETESARVTSDTLLGGKVALQQPAAGYRVAIDPVLLAAAVPASDGERALDVGCGVGAGALCLAKRVTGLHVTGIEVDRSFAQLAKENAALNGLEECLDVLVGDFKRPPPKLSPKSFDHVFANPPFFEDGSHQSPASRTRAQATMEGAAGLEVWLEFCARMVRPGGSITIIHRPERLAQILGSLSQARAGAIVVYPLWSHNPFSGARAKKTANRIIVQATAEHGGPLQLASGMILHDADGTYAHTADRVLRSGGALALLEEPSC